MALGGAARRGGAAAPYKGFAVGKALAQGGFTPPEQARKIQRFCGAGKKKMRTLGTVQLPTEAFMAVLKLDE